MKFIFILFNILIISLAYPNYSISQLHYDIYGTVDNNGYNLKDYSLKNGTFVKVYLNGKPIDSSTITNNSFHLSGIVNEPSVVMVKSTGIGIKLMLDNNQYFINFKLDRIDDKKFQYIPTVKTTSSYHNLWSNFYDTLGYLYKEKNNYLDILGFAHNKDSISNTKKTIDSIDRKIAYSYKKLVFNNPNNYATVYILFDAPDFNYQTYSVLYKLLPDSIQNSYYGKLLSNKLEMLKTAPSTTIPFNNDNTFNNNKMPEFYVINNEGKTIKIDSIFFNKYKYTIFDFWASWCSPCRKENINLKSFQLKNTKKGIQLVSFSLDNDADAWKKAIKNDGYNWLQISDLKAANSDIVQYFHIEFIPFNLIVNSNGKIIATNIHGKELESFFEANN